MIGHKATNFFPVKKNTFKEINELAKDCKFRDCQHKTEPKCAVKEAVLNGKLAPETLERYHASR